MSLLLLPSGSNVFEGVGVRACRVNVVANLFFIIMWYLVGYKTISAQVEADEKDVNIMEVVAEKCVVEKDGRREVWPSEFLGINLDGNIDP